ncbi:MAG: RNA polymerase sigma factor [Phycisphaerae bacterium]|nr:RNA polymerase sigma factor [Phycisphaerae bacterium]
MVKQSEQELQRQIASGDERAFERAYDHFATQVRLVAFRITHRADWIDDLANEAWCRAFRQRSGYAPDKPFLVWMAGILRNVYREFCRDSHRSIGHAGEGVGSDKVDRNSPEEIAHEAEVLAALKDCVGGLDAESARIVRLRYFQNLTLRQVAQEVKIPEATLREVQIPRITEQLRRCLRAKKIEFSEIFSAQAGDEVQ